MPDLRRRLFVAASGAATAWPLAARTQTRTPRRIVVLHSGYPLRTPIARLFNGLRALGYEDGKSATIELLAGEGDPQRLREIVARIGAQPPDVTIAITEPAAQALKEAGMTAPVVFAFVSDPVATGLVASLSRPGGNFTGVTFSGPSLGGKRVELLMDMLPGLRRVAVIWSPAFAGNVVVFDSARESARARGVELVAREVRTVEDVVAAFSAAREDGAQAAIFINDNYFFGRRKEVAAAALASRMPTIFAFALEVEDGGLMSFGPDLNESYQRAAALADAVLKGARPADLPVEEPTRFSLAVNLKTAAALGITVPPTILVRADDLIE